MIGKKCFQDGCNEPANGNQVYCDFHLNQKVMFVAEQMLKQERENYLRQKYSDSPIVKEAEAVLKNYEDELRRSGR